MIVEVKTVEACRGAAATGCWCRENSDLCRFCGVHVDFDDARADRVGIVWYANGSSAHGDCFDAAKFTFSVCAAKVDTDA